MTLPTQAQTAKTISDLHVIKGSQNLSIRPFAIHSSHRMFLFNCRKFATYQKSKQQLTLIPEAMKKRRFNAAR